MMLLRHYKSNMQLVMGSPFLVQLGADDFGVYNPGVGPNLFGTSLMVRGPLADLKAFFEKKGLEMPNLR